MAKRSRGKQVVDPEGDQPPPSSPFAELAGLRAQLPPGDAAPVAPPDAEGPTFAAKVILSRQRKGRGGKTVTVLQGVLLTERARSELMRELGHALGTNVRDEDGEIVMAGDQRQRARAWLEARGARVVTSG